jgi:hypothetical protein
MKLNRFKQLLESTMGDVRPIICEYEIAEDEIDLDKTYLSKEKITKQKEDIKSWGEPKQPKVVDLTGKIFKDEGTTTSDNYMRGLDFDEVHDGFYKVNFSSEFIEKYFSLPSSQVYKTTSLYGNEHGDQPVPLVIKIDNKEYDIEDLLTDVHIKTEGYPTNRIHFPGGVGASLEGTGLGYLIYQQFIKYLGFGSSKPNASSKAQVVWSKLAKDPDFYSFVAQSDFDTYVFVISKTNPIGDPKNIVVDLLDNLYRNKSSKIDVVLGSELKRDFPEIETMFSSPSDPIIKKNMANLKLYIDYILQISDKSIEKLNGEFPSKMVEYSSKIIEMVTDDTNPPFSTTKSIYNEVKELYDKFVEKFYDPSSPPFKDGQPNPNPKVNSKYEKYVDKYGVGPNNFMLSLSNPEDGPNNFMSSLYNIEQFFINYFNMIEYQQKISGVFN